MAIDPARRALLSRAAALAAGGWAGIATGQPTAPGAATAAAAASSSPPGSAGALEYLSAGQLTEGLRRRRFSSLELTDHLIARIERARRRDQCRRRARLRACSRGRPGRRRGAGARRPAAAARPADDGEGIVQRGRPADHLGHPAGQGLPRQRRRADRRARPKGRCRPARQDQRADRARRLAELQRDLRRHAQPLGPRAHAGRLVGRLVGSAGGGLRAPGTRFRHRRLAARAGALRWRHVAHKPTLGLVPSRGHAPPGAPPLPRNDDLVGRRTDGAHRR